ncbi:MAG: T9SS type A sorting domain-containing protein [Chloroflexota bacterium]
MGFYTNCLKLRNLILAAASLSIAQAAPIDEPLPAGAQRAESGKVQAFFGGDPTVNAFSVNKFNTKKPGDKFQEGESLYLIIDSVANSLTFENDVQEPFTYEPVSGELGLILRGFYNPNEVGHGPANSKNNIFIKISKDLGASWEPTVRVYNYQSNPPYGGRYPSISSYNKEGEVIYPFTLSLVDEDNGEWRGFETGIYGENLGNGYATSPSFTSGGKTFQWGGRGRDENGKVSVVSGESKIIGSVTNDGRALALAVGGVTPVGAGVDTLENNNIAFRRTIEVETEVIDAYIPPQMTNDKFEPVNTQFARSSTLVALRKTADEKYYLGVFGNFASEPTKDRAEPGFSTSTDLGLTWSEFNVMPGSLLKDFAEQNGIIRDSIFIDYNRKDMAVLNDGTVVFAVMVNESNSSKAPQDVLHFIAAITCNPSGTWSIEKIARHSGIWMGLIDDNGQPVYKASATELQLSKTSDESALAAKWVDLLGITWKDDGSASFLNADVYFSIKNLNDGNKAWSDTVNVTRSGVLDRDVWIPYPLTEDLHRIPAVQLFTKSSNLTNLEQQTYLSKQYVAYSLFDVLANMGANEPQIQNGEFNATISPNPATDRAELSFTAARPGKFTVKIYNAYGELALDAFEGESTETLNAIELKLGSLPSGAYFVRTQAGDAVNTQKLNIIR